MYIGVDVGTGSARACLMDESGELWAVASKDILKFEPKPEHINQSTADIWSSICYCTKKILAETEVPASQIRGIAFDATCSLVALNNQSSPVPVGPDFSSKEQDVILWMDHRAVDETQRIKATQHSLLKYVGGQMSIEMEIPKIMWLKNHMPKEMFDQCRFYDLADWLTEKATGVDARSYCSVTCKQGYVPKGVDGSTTGWNEQFLTSIGLGELCQDDFHRLGGVAGLNGNYHSAGEPVGTLTEKAASELGLSMSTVVGSGVIDAYSGWIGTVAAKTGSLLADLRIQSRLAAVAGTSTCHIVLSDDPVFVPGVWGPYRDVLIPGKWCAEGGQSTTGELLRYIVTTHAASKQLEKEADSLRMSPYDVLNNRLEELRKTRGVPTIYHLAKHLFWYGDLYGNRSPIADPSMTGAVVGLTMDSSLDDLAIQYLAIVEFICQQTRQIIDKMNECGHDIQAIYLSGGQCRNSVLTQLMATCTGKPLVIPRYIDSAVVIGTAMLAARAANPEKSLWDVMSTHSQPGKVVEPITDPTVVSLLHAKYTVFLDQIERQQHYRKLVSKALEGSKETRP